jgi:hypothetical protein
MMTEVKISCASNIVAAQHREEIAGFLQEPL